MLRQGDLPNRTAKLEASVPGVVPVAHVEDLANGPQVARTDEANIALAVDLQDGIEGFQRRVLHIAIAEEDAPGAVFEVVIPASNGDGFAGEGIDVQDIVHFDLALHGKAVLEEENALLLWDGSSGKSSAGEQQGEGGQDNAPGAPVVPGVGVNMTGPPAGKDSLTATLPPFILPTGEVSSSNC